MRLSCLTGPRDGPLMRAWRRPRVAAPAARRAGPPGVGSKPPGPPSITRRASPSSRPARDAAGPADGRCRPGSTAACAAARGTSIWSGPCPRGPRSRARCRRWGWRPAKTVRAGGRCRTADQAPAVAARGRTRRQTVPSAGQGGSAGSSPVIVAPASGTAWRWPSVRARRGVGDVARAAARQPATVVVERDQRGSSSTCAARAAAADLDQHGAWPRRDAQRDAEESAPRRRRPRPRPRPRRRSAGGVAWRGRAVLAAGRTRPGRPRRASGRSPRPSISWGRLARRDHVPDGTRSKDDGPRQRGTPASARRLGQLRDRLLVARRAVLGGHGFKALGRRGGVVRGTGGCRACGCHERRRGRQHGRDQCGRTGACAAGRAWLRHSERNHRGVGIVAVGVRFRTNF